MRVETFATMVDEMILDPVAGDILVLFSDGITDARNPNGQDLGYERLARIVVENRELSSRDLTLKILSTVAEYTESGNFDDDATVVVMKCR